MARRSPIGIAIAGFGTVGQGVWKHLQQRRSLIEARLGAPFELIGATVRDVAKPRLVAIDPRSLSTDPLALAKDPRVDILCELIGGTDHALALTEAALQAGKTVVTANKALLCHHGEHLFRMARQCNAHIYFEASVAGGIPIIKALREGLVVNRFPLIYGILNGTCNYILTRMEREGKSYEEILSDARRLGYVEADEALDLDGIDAAHKACILAYLAHGKWIPLGQMPVEGIRGITLEDIHWAQRLGFKIKLLALILKDEEAGRVFCSVQPSLLPRDMVLASVDGVFNAIAVTGDVVGDSVYLGRGAGQDATASAVISDVVDAGMAIAHGILPAEPRDNRTLELSRLEDVRRAFYIRMAVRDEPGVLAEVASIMARAGVSIESVLQRPQPAGGSAQLVLTTHETTEAAMQLVVQTLKGLRALLQPPLLLRIADFASKLG